jgi:hypothetical protein
VTIPPFYVGPTRGEKLKYRCERAGSDYYARYSNMLKGTSSIERAPKSVTILDVDYVQTDCLSTPSRWMHRPCYHR